MRYLTLAILFLASACGDNRIGEHRYPPKPENAPIEIFLTKQPTREYEEVGYFRRSVGKRGNPIPWAQAVTREVGGDACIVHTNAGTFQSGNWLANGSDGATIMEVIAIHWSDGPTAKAPAP